MLVFLKFQLRAHQNRKIYEHLDKQLKTTANKITFIWVLVAEGPIS